MVPYQDTPCIEVTRSLTMTILQVMWEQHAVVTVDTTAPNSPVTDQCKQSCHSSTAEPGSTVKVTFPDGVQ